MRCDVLSLANICDWFGANPADVLGMEYEGPKSRDVLRAQYLVNRAANCLEVYQKFTNVVDSAHQKDLAIGDLSLALSILEREDDIGSGAVNA
jgi:hypothetical protein